MLRNTFPGVISWDEWRERWNAPETTEPEALGLLYAAFSIPGSQAEAVKFFVQLSQETATHEEINRIAQQVLVKNFKHLPDQPNPTIANWLAVRHYPNLASDPYPRFIQVYLTRVLKQMRERTVAGDQSIWAALLWGASSGVLDIAYSETGVTKSKVIETIETFFKAHDLGLACCLNYAAERIMSGEGIPKLDHLGVNQTWNWTTIGMQAALTHAALKSTGGPQIGHPPAM